MSAPDRLAAVVLAGGASRRMGRDKATIPHPGPHPGPSGLTMVEYTVGVLATRCSPVFVVGAAGQALPPLAARILRDDVPGAGPLPATGLGLRAARAAGRDRAFVSAVDMPYLSADLVDELAVHTGVDELAAHTGVDELAAYTGVDVVLPWDGRTHYLAGVYRTGLADRIEALVATGERRMRALADAVVTRRVVVPLSAPLTNLNEPSDLR